jgi:hypothetical protein
MANPEGLDFDPYKAGSAEPKKQFPQGLDFDPYKEVEEKKPSLLEAVPYGLRKGMESAARMYEIPVRPILKETLPLLGKRQGPPGSRFEIPREIQPEDVLPSEYLKPSKEQEERVAQLGIPGQIVSGLAQLPGAILKYGPLMRAVGGVAGALGPGRLAVAAGRASPFAQAAANIGAGAGVFGAEAAAEKLSEGAKLSPRELAEEGGIGAVFGLLDQVPGGRAARAAMLSGTFSFQAFADTFGQTKDLGTSLKAAIAPGVIGAGLGAISRGPEARALPEPTDFGALGIRPEPRPLYAGMGPRPGVPLEPERFRVSREPGRPLRGEYPGVPTEPLPIPEREYPFVTRRRLTYPEGAQYVAGEPQAISPEGFVYKQVTPRAYREGPTPTTPLEPLGPEKPGPPTPTPPEAPERPPGPDFGLSEKQIGAVRENAAKIDGGISIDLIKRWAGIGTKRASETFEKMVEAGEIVPGGPESAFPYKLKGFKMPLRYENEIRDLRESLNSKAKSIIDRAFEGEIFEGDDLKIWNKIREKAQDNFNTRVEEEWARKQAQILESDPNVENIETEKFLTDGVDDWIIGFRQELEDEGWPKDLVEKAISEARTRLEGGEAPETFDQIKAELAEELNRKPTEESVAEVKIPKVDGLTFKGVDKTGDPTIPGLYHFDIDNEVLEKAGIPTDPNTRVSIAVAEENLTPEFLKQRIDEKIAEFKVTPARDSKVLFSTGDKVIVNGREGVINERNADGTYSVGFPDGGMIDAPPEAIETFVPERQIIADKDTGEIKAVDKQGGEIIPPKEGPEPPASEDKLPKPEAAIGEPVEHPLSREAVQGFAIERLKQYPGAPEVEIVDTFEDIPDRIREQLRSNLGDNVRGVYDPMTKKIYLVTQMLGSEQDVLSAIEHETIGHFAMESYLGPENAKFYNRVYMKYGRTGLQNIADQRGFNLDTQEGRLNAAREKVAQLAESGQEPGLLKQLYGWIREQLAKLNPDWKITDSEIQRTIMKARDYLASGEAQLREAKVDALRRQVRAIGAVPLGEPFRPAEFSIADKIKETGKQVGKVALEEEVKPKIESAKDAWEWLKNKIAPTSGVDVKDLDAMMRMKGDRELAQTKVEYDTEKAFDRVSKLNPAEQVDLVDKIQMGRETELPDDLKEIARLHRAIEDSLWGEANVVLRSLSEPERIAYLENHVRNFWKVVPRGLEDEIQKKGFSGLWRRPLEGTRAPLHHQYWTLKEGMENGGVPFTTNLIEMTRLNYQDTMKLITAHKMWDFLLDIGHRKFVKFGEEIQEGFRAINDRIANQYFPRKFDDTELRRTAMSDPDPAKREAAANKLNRYMIEGPPKELGRGRWVVEDNVGRILENYLSRDLVREHPLTRGIMAIKNVTTAMELGFSAFHASFITFEAAASQMGLGLRKIWNQGQIEAGLKDIITAPKAGYDLYQIGRQWERLMKDPQGFLSTTKGQEFMKMFPQAADDIGWLYWGGGSMRMNESYRINSINVFKENLHAKNYIGAALRSIPGMAQWMIKPLFETYIPALKRAQFLREFNFRQTEQQADLLSGKITKAELARNVWKSVENRFGEMNFDNLWWDRTFKSGLQMFVRSVTWKLGNIREYGKGFEGQTREILSAIKEGRKPRLTQEAAWMWGLFSLTAAMASITQYAFTGKTPENWKDLVYPQIDNQGGRLSLPTYARDFFSLTHSPVKYAGSSMAGWFGRFQDIISNKDFYGVQVHDPSENIVYQRIDDLIHLVPLPFSIQSLERMRAEGETPTRQVAGFLGGTKAPYWVEKTAAEQKASELKAAHLPIGGRSPADFARGQLVKNYAKRYQEAVLKNEPTEDIMTEFHGDIAAGKLKLQDLLTFRSRISKEPLVDAVAHLPFKDVLEVFRVASSDEKKKLYPILNRKFYGIRSPEDRITYMPKMREVTEQMRAQ